jgi:N-acylneuraminate cytidylyltransferase
VRIAVIPARGGSKRIKNKNIREFVGKPLISYSLAAAKDAGLFDEIIVSTDSSEIAAVSRQYGATYIVDRSADLSDDFTGTTPVVRDAIKCYELNLEEEVEQVCCIYATAPFLSAHALRSGFEKLLNTENAKFAFSVTSFPFPIQRSIRMVGNGVEPVFEKQIKMRSQDLEEYYHDAGQFYWGTRNAWLASTGMFKAHSCPIVLPRYLVQDIDTYEDWQRAELMYRAYIKDNENE